MPASRVRLLRIGLLLSLLVTAGSPSASEVFRRTNADGSVEFSDIKKSDGEQPLDAEETAPGLIIPSDRRLKNVAPRAPKREDATANVRIAITSPTNDTALRDNSGNLSVVVKVDPHLAHNHFITLTSSNGTKANPQKGFQFIFKNLDRGSHTFTANVVDGKGKVITSSDPVTIHLLRNSILFPNQRNR